MGVSGPSEGIRWVCQGRVRGSGGCVRAECPSFLGGRGGGGLCVQLGTHIFCFNDHTPIKILLVILLTLHQSILEQSTELEVYNRTV